MESDENIVKKEKSMTVEESDKNTVENKASSIVVIDFMAEWCGPCKMQDPILAELKKKFEGRSIFKKIDIDKEGELANKYKVMAVPTLIIEKDGNVFKRYVGVTRLKELENAINDALK
jgi:thioredoxin 1